MTNFPARPLHCPSPGRLALQLTILTLSATTGWPPLSILKETFLIRKVHTSSQKRYVSREPCECGAEDAPVSLIYACYSPFVRSHALGDGRCGADGVPPHLERQPCLDLVLKHVCDGSVEVGEDLHRQLRVDASVRDEVIESVCQGGADAIPRFVMLASLRLGASKEQRCNVPATAVQLVVVLLRTGSHLELRWLLVLGRRS